MDVPASKYPAEPLPALHAPCDYRTQPLIFKPMADTVMTAAEPERRQRSSSRATEKRAAAASTSVDVAPFRSHSGTRGSRASSRPASERPQLYRPTRASVLRQKATIEKEIEALLQAELESEREGDYAEGFTRSVYTAAGSLSECVPTRANRSAVLRQEHARRVSAMQISGQQDSQRPSTPRVRSASLRTQDAAEPVIVRATRAAELRRSLNAQRLRELELARAKLEQEEALIEQGQGGALRELARASWGQPVAEDVAPAVKSTKAAELLRQRVESKMKELARLEAVEAAAQEAILHPPSSRVDSANGSAQRLSPRSTKSSLLRGRTAAAHMLPTTPTHQGRHQDPESSAVPPRRRASTSKSTTTTPRGKKDTHNGQDAQRHVASSAAGAFDTFASRASTSGFVVHHPSEPALSIASEVEDAAVQLPSAILQIDHVVSDSEIREGGRAEPPDSCDASTGPAASDNARMTVAEPAVATDVDTVVVSPLEAVSVDEAHAGGDAPCDGNVQDDTPAQDAVVLPVLPEANEAHISDSMGGEEEQEADEHSEAVDAQQEEEIHDTAPTSLPVPPSNETYPSASTNKTARGVDDSVPAEAPKSSAGVETNSAHSAPSSIRSHSSDSDDDSIQQVTLESSHDEVPRDDSHDRSVLSAHDASQMEEPLTPRKEALDAPANTEVVEPTAFVDEAPGPLPRARTAPRVTTSVGPPAAEHAVSPSPTEPPLTAATVSTAPTAAPVVTHTKSRSSSSLSGQAQQQKQQKQQVETLDRARKARAAMPPSAPPPLAPTGEANSNNNNDSDTSSIESVPTFVAVGAVTPSLPVSATDGAASPASYQWSRRPTPPLHAPVDAVRSSISWVDVSGASASSAAASPSPVSFRQFRQNVNRVLYRRYFTKWASFKRSHMPQSTLSAVPHGPAPVKEDEEAMRQPRRSQTAPPLSSQLPDANPPVHAQPAVVHVESGPQLPTTNRAPHAHAAASSDGTAPPSVNAPSHPSPGPQRATAPPAPSKVPAAQPPVKEEGAPMEPSPSRPPPPSSSSSPSHAIPHARPSSSYSSPSPAAARAVVAPPHGPRPPHLAPALLTGNSRLSHSSGPQQTSPSKGLRVPRLQESFASLPRGTAANGCQANNNSVATPPAVAADSWQALEASPVSALSQPHHTTMSSLRSTPHASHLLALPSPIPRVATTSGVTPPKALPYDVWTPSPTATAVLRPEGSGTPAAIRMPPVAPDGWAVVPPDPIDVSTSLLEPRPQNTTTTTPPHSGARAPVMQDGFYYSPPQRRSATAIVDSPREMGERTPCDKALDTLLLDHDVDGAPRGRSFDLAVDGDREPSQHAPTPLLSSLQQPSSPAIPNNTQEAAAYDWQQQDEGEEEEEGEGEADDERDESVYTDDTSSASDDKHGGVPLSEHEHNAGSSDDGDMPQQSPLHAAPVEEDDDEVDEIEADILRRCRRDGSRGFSSSSAASVPAVGPSEETAPVQEPADGAATVADEAHEDSPPARPVYGEGGKSTPDPTDGGAAQIPLTRMSTVSEAYRPPSPIPSMAGSTGRAETYYMSVSNPTPCDSHWGAGSPDEGSPNGLNVVDPELQRDFENRGDPTRVIQYVHREM